MQHQLGPRLASRADRLPLPFLLDRAAGGRSGGGDRLPPPDQPLPALRGRRHAGQPAAAEPGLRGASGPTPFQIFPTAWDRQIAALNAVGQNARTFGLIGFLVLCWFSTTLPGEYRSRLFPPLQPSDHALAATARRRLAADPRAGGRPRRDGPPHQRRGVARRRGADATRGQRAILGPIVQVGTSATGFFLAFLLLLNLYWLIPDVETRPRDALPGAFSAPPSSPSRSNSSALPPLPTELDLRRRSRLHFPADHLALSAGAHPPPRQCAERLPLALTARLPRAIRAGIVRGE